MLKSLILGVSVPDLWIWCSPSRPKEKKSVILYQVILLTVSLFCSFLCVLGQFSGVSRPFVP